MAIAVLILVAVLAASLGIVLGRYLWPARRGVDPALFASTQAEAARLNQECVTLRSRADELASQGRTAADQARTAGEEVARLTERASSLAAQLQEQTTQATTLQTQRDNAINEAGKAATEVARLTERESALTQQLTTQAQQIAEMQKRLTVEFENIASRVLKASASDSVKTLETILDPFRERIREFQTKVETTYQAENREVLSLKEQIKLILDTSNAIGGQADSLAKALRGDSQLLGRWGELALERILETAGLTEGREYTSQGRGMGLKSDTGGVQKPDIVISLPEQRTMIIDSKVPLAGYERLVAAKPGDDTAKIAGQFVQDMKGHIDGLAGKRYQDNEKLQAHDCVLMFVPIEGALAAALTADAELFFYGWNRRVILVGPPTLLMTMQTVASIWRYEDQRQNAQEIARLAGDLCDKIALSLADLNDVAEKITAALNCHYEAVKRLTTGKGNALSLGERIRSLGVKTKRPMPAMLVDGGPAKAAEETSGDDVVAATDPAAFRPERE